jgi:alkylation response protein AidB-like acyl-CoA dehydrogenase
MKLAFSQLATLMAKVAVDAQGAMGTLVGDEAPDHGTWQQQFLSAPSFRIAAGTDEVQRNVLGERVLGLPAEPRADKDAPFRAR